jgi:DNA helicase HerA-like ATPase
MLEYHTAILGVTGTGKTELAFDIIRYALSQGTTVFCVDFTGEYRLRLADVNPEALGLDEEQARTLQERLFDVETGEYAAGDEKKALGEFIEEITPGIVSQVDEFLKQDVPSIGIFEIEEIANTKATLRATELYLSTIFNWARRNRRKRRILLVLEEAHTIVPETNLFRFDRVETSAVVGRMAQIALQGRKYSVGILLISQRTALVSKTLLSQCNTVFSFALHDETGLNYLGNVFSTDYVRVIPNLKFLQGVAFGKAVRSDRPVIFEIPWNEDKKKASESLDKSYEEESHEEAPPALEISSESMIDGDNEIPF